MSSGFYPITLTEYSISCLFLMMLYSVYGLFNVKCVDYKYFYDVYADVL